MTEENVTYIQVESDNESLYRNGFFETYQEAFSGPPYFEHHEFEDIIHRVWLPHLSYGIVVVAQVNHHVVGFGCARPVAEVKDEGTDFLLKNYVEGIVPVHPSSMWYMSELAVRTSHRGQGIGLKLIKERLMIMAQRDHAWYVMRTAATGSNSERLYERIGAMRIPGTQDASTCRLVRENASQSTERIFFYGNCAETLSSLG